MCYICACLCLRVYLCLGTWAVYALISLRSTYTHKYSERYYFLRAALQETQTYCVYTEART